MARRFLSSGVLLLALGLAAIANAAGERAEDHRAWQHGVNLIQVGDKLLLVWGSAGNPPRPNPGGGWPHDVYYAWLDERVMQAARQEIAPPRVTPPAPQILVSLPEAQEPPSAAINSNGTILMTSEDGNGGINQNAGLWDSALRVLRKYPFTIRRGGHSGHAAAMGQRFLVAYSEGWVEGGGWLGLGTGKNVYARVVEDNGKLGGEIKLSPERASQPRDGWPLVAGSDRNWLVVWQRYPGLTLQAALVDESGKVVKQHQIIGGLPLRYAYDVQFSPLLAAYVVAGSTGGGGFVSLLGLSGEILQTQQGLPPMAPESRLILGRDGADVIGVYPASPRGVAVVRLSAGAIGPAKVIDHPYVWDHAGTTGAFVAAGRLLFATLSRTGLQLIPIDLRD